MYMYVMYNTIVGDPFRILKAEHQYTIETLCTCSWIQSAKLTRKSLWALKDEYFVQNSTMTVKHGLLFLSVIMKPDHVGFNYNKLGYLQILHNIFQPEMQ